MIVARSPIISVPFNPDGSPKHAFTRIEDRGTVQIRFELPHFCLGLQLVMEPMAVAAAPRRYTLDSDELLVPGPPAGTFRYQLQDGSIAYPPGYLQFATRLESGVMPSDIRLQTILTKWTRPSEFCEWLVPSLSAAGYNMIHMVPIQERGLSDSPYSIRNQLRLSDDFIGAADDQKQPSIGERETLKEKTLDDMLQACRAHGLLSMVDVVWNHTACDSAWLLEHPEAGYTLETAPHLRAAWELDEAILIYSCELGESNNNVIATPDDLERVIGGFAKKINELRLYEYFILDTEAHVSQFSPCNGSHSPHAFAVHTDGRYGRFSNHLDMALINAVVESAEQLRDKLDQLNQAKFAEWNEIYAAVLNNCRARLHYERLAPDGPKLGPITARTPMLSPYFTRLLPPDQTQPIAFANNGWVWDADPLENFAEPPGHCYLRRDLIIWGDCVKLRYGSEPAHNPWLWEHMAEYTRKAAARFHGLRIDNCHSTPLPVARWLLKQARLVRPNIYIVAELFTGRADRDLLFVGELGLDSLIREAMQCGDAGELGRAVARYAGASIGHSPHALFMDCTHDNPAPAQKRTAVDAFTTAAVVAMTPCAVGSVRGFDQLCPEHLNIVSEQRLYECSGRQTPVERLKSLLFKLRAEWVKCKQIDIASEEERGLIKLSAIWNKHEYVLYAKTAFSKEDACVTVQIPEHAAILAAWKLEIDHQFVPDVERITGLKGELHEITDNVMNPGSIILCRMPSDDTDCLQRINAFYLSPSMKEPFKDLGLTELNMLLYRTDTEERDMAPPFGVYVVPDHGPLAYCGIAGFHLALKHANLCSDPFTANARNGSWMLDYTLQRLVARNFNPRVLDALRILFGMIKELSRVERPKETFRAFHLVYEACMERARVLLNALDEFDLRLALGLVQMYGVVGSTGYNPGKITPSLAAGLPHFATNHMRCWGRDTFTSYRGFFLLSKQFDEGLAVIKAFGGCLFHGLIPNLLDAQRYPRFNSRDAVWWFVYSVLEHARLQASILDEKVLMRFPGNIYVDYRDWLLQSNPCCTVREILVAILKSHAEGIAFREHNAGPNLDQHMTDQGFNVDICVDWNTGLIYGGNEHNAGTWMDKMGSVPGLNAGVPSTPRDGAAVEINALCLYSLELFLCLIGDCQLTDRQSVFSWHSLLKSNFESSFYSPQLQCYSDCIGSTRSDHQIRPNFLIATALLPHVLRPENVQTALSTCTRELLSKNGIGMRTLSFNDHAYRPNYNLNGENAGADYHNGPEWPWLTPFYLMSVRKYNPESSSQLLTRLHYWLKSSPYGGITELTNDDGQDCWHSCPTQSWSLSCLRQYLHSSP